MVRSAEIPPAGNPDRRPRRTHIAGKAVIHVLVGAHLAAVICWSCSAPKPVTPVDRLIRARLAPYILPVGFWHTWDMFANAPISNNYLEAEVTFADDSRATWPFPRVDRLPYFQRYRSERYRKWVTERVVAAGNPAPLVAEAAARFAARQVERPGNPPRKVELIRYRSQTPPPRRVQLQPHTEAPQDWERQLLYTCEFDGSGRMTRGYPATQSTAAPPGKMSSAATQPVEEPVPPDGGE